MWNVWRTVLEENEKLAKARLAAVEVFQQQIADEAKVLRSHKVQTSRKVRNFYLFVEEKCFISWVFGGKVCRSTGISTKGVARQCGGFRQNEKIVL